MSALSSGSENGLWNAVMRWAEPLIMKITLVDEADVELQAALGVEAVNGSVMDEDGERWDGLS